MSNNTNFFDKVYESVKKIPKGKVATYGQIAALSGNPKASRVVGTALHHNPDNKKIPCHRVVNRFGRLAPAYAFGGMDVQRSILEDEGVTVNDDYTVDLTQYKWNPDL